MNGWEALPGALVAAAIVAISIWTLVLGIRRAGSVAAAEVCIPVEGATPVVFQDSKQKWVFQGRRTWGSTLPGGTREGDYYLWTTRGPSGMMHHRVIEVDKFWGKK